MMDLYEKILTIARNVGYQEGYAIGLHGSGIRDLDLIACPWTETACDPVIFANHLVSCLELATIHARFVDEGIEGAQEMAKWPAPCLKPHGRLAVTIFVECQFYIDLSIMPRSGA